MSEVAGLAAACTSEARISPPGPEPRKAAISTPNSFARRRAFGEILAALAAGGWDATGASGPTHDSGFPLAACAFEVSYSAGGFLSGGTIRVMVRSPADTGPT